jgi:RNA polymerase sigma factor (sigma-70 family)
VEVSTLRYSRGIGLHGRSPLLRLQSDERLIAYVRRGNNAAFEVLVARYQSRLLSFCRHLLGSREDAEDVLQEVMAAAFNAILADDRPINVRPWLYRIARNRSLNHLRRIQAVGVDSMDVHLSDNGATTADKVHEREEFRVLVEDIQDLPETQRTALVLREMDALSYEQIAEAMETTVPSVKSLLVRARVSLAEAAQARMLTCEDVRIELGEVAEGLRRRPSSLVRRHLRSCKRCSSFKVQLRETNKALTALLPIGPMVFVLRKLALVHLGHSAGAGAGAGTGATGAGAAGQAAAVGGTAAAGAGATATLGSAGGILSAGVGAIATKAAAGLAAAALVTAGAVEVSQRPAPTTVAVTHHHPVVVATPPPAPAPATHSTQSFQSTVVEVHPKKSVKKAAVANKARDNAQPASKPADKTSDKATKTTATTATTTPTTAAPTEPPGRQQTQTDPTVLPPSPTPTSSTPTATTAPAPTTTPATTPTTTDPATPTTTGPTATTPTATTPTTTPLPPTDQPPAVDPPVDNSSPTDPVGAASSSSPVLDSFASAPPHHRHRHHDSLTW